MEDLIVVTPDGAYPLVLEEFLKRAASLGVCSVSRRIIMDPLRDSSGELPDLLRPFLGKSRKALGIPRPGGEWLGRARRGRARRASAGKNAQERLGFQRLRCDRRAA